MKILRHAKFEKYTEEKAFVDAEEFCVEKGGHLASVVTKEEQQELEKVAEEGDDDLPGGGFWLGGSDMAEEGVWEWTDRQKLWGAFTNWVKDEEPDAGGAGALKTKGKESFKWEVGLRPFPRQFICRFERSLLNSSSYRWNKKELGHSLNFWLRPSKMALEAMVGRGKMPGMNILWKVEGEERRRSSMQTETGEVGRKVESPLFGKLGWDLWAKANHVHKASLVTSDLAERMSDGDSLVVEVTSDLGNKGELVVGQGNSFPGQLLPTRSLLLYVDHKLDWAGAESFCVASGGHLASVHSLQDLEELAQLLLRNKAGRAWVGGTDLEVEGEWMWTDDTVFNFTK